MRSERLVRAGGAVVVLLALAGCGPKVGQVSGTVTVDGKTPTDEGWITFTPADGKTAVEGGKIVDGHYSARVPPGPKKVSISLPKVVGKKKIYDTPNSPVMDIKKEFLPERYNEKTELEYEVKPGAYEKNWELSSK